VNDLLETEKNGKAKQINEGTLKIKISDAIKILAKK
jgi:hypothetical protein